VTLFRRRPRGRHALGGAVTGIPSQPLAPYVPAPLPTVRPDAVSAPAPAVPAPSAQPSTEPSVLSSIAQLIATGEAWADPARDLPQLPAVHEVSWAERVAPAGDRSSAPVAVTVPSGSTPGPRVSLGFRDGSSAALDPASEHAAALEQLARTLTVPSGN
jgi:hypothetical protein